MEEQSLFQVRFTDEGKKYIRKFASLSYFMMALVILEACVTIYWNIESLVSNSTGVLGNLYFQVFPYIMILASLLVVFSNLYYLRFPHKLLRSIETNDELRANTAFRFLFKGVVIFFFSLLLNGAMIIWSILSL